MRDKMSHASTTRKALSKERFRQIIGDVRIWIPVLLICLGWSLLSQIQVNRFTNPPRFLGTDGILTFLENKTLEWRYLLRGNIESPVKVIYVNQDGDSLSEFGQHPWNRELFAQVADILFRYGGVKSIGFDYVFSERGRPNLGQEEFAEGSKALGKVIHKHRNIVVAATYGSSAEDHAFPFLFDPVAARDADPPELPDYPVVGPSWGTIGLINTVSSTPLVPVFAQTDHVTYYAMSLQLALQWWGLNATSIKIEPNDVVVLDKEGQELRRIPLVLHQLADINWFSNWSQNEQFSIAKVIKYGAAMEDADAETREALDEFFAQFRDSIVLIGPTDPLLQDTDTTLTDPEAPVPRVSVHGNMVKTILSGRFLHRPPTWVNVFIIFTFGLATTAVCLRQGAAWRYGAVGFVLLYIVAAFLLFARADIVLPLVAPVGAALLCSFSAILWQLGVEEKKRRWIRSVFGTYVSPQIVDEMISQNMTPQVGGVELEITAFFSDIEAFSPLAESLEPNRLVELMNEYLGECTAPITKHDGTLDKYVGDAIIAIFGAPLARRDHAASACRASLDFLKAQKALCERWASEDGRWPEKALNIRTRIGLNSGDAVVGNMGSRLRVNYTMMGDNVNLAQRLEATAGVFGVQILTSASTRDEALREDKTFEFRHIDRVLVPGRARPVEVYELLGVKGDLGGQPLKCRQIYEDGLAHYFRAEWSEAEGCFLRSAELEERQGLHNPSQVMARRCQQFRHNPPPADWNFAFKLTKGG